MRLEGSGVAAVVMVVGAGSTTMLSIANAVSGLRSETLMATEVARAGGPPKNSVAVSISVCQMPGFDEVAKSIPDVE
jgi:hypothetical protein